MPKKIIFIGPPKAGKTTLRKIFFEGENASRLLEYSPEPTHGQESVILDLSESVGIFDLAGQENQRWLETDEKSIFYDSEIIIVVIDITSSSIEILEFIKKVIKIRNELIPSTYIYILLHKVDLITRNKLNDIKANVIAELGIENHLRLAFTSIKKNYFLDTLSLFMDILKTCTSKLIKFEKVNLNFIKATIKLLYHIHQEVVVSKSDLNKKLRFADEIIERIFTILENKGHIEINEINNKSIVSLTEKGKKFFKKILENFSLDLISFETDFFEQTLDKKTIPSFLGFMIADKDGKTAIATEVFEGAFKLCLKPEYEEHFADPELIPMFISALEKFSSEINIKNLSGFKLRGSNIMMHTFHYDLFTVTLFMNTDINLKPFKDEINQWFDALFIKYKFEFEKSLYIGDVSKLEQVKSEGRLWLNQLNQKYEEMAINLNIFDFKQATDFYEKMQNKSRDYQFKYSIFTKKMQKLKEDFMKAFYEENFTEIKQIAKNITQLKV